MSQTSRTKLPKKTRDDQQLTVIRGRSISDIHRGVFSEFEIDCSGRQRHFATIFAQLRGTAFNLLWTRSYVFRPKYHYIYKSRKVFFTHDDSNVCRLARPYQTTVQDLEENIQQQTEMNPTMIDQYSINYAMQANI